MIMSTGAKQHAEPDRTKRRLLWWCIGILTLFSLVMGGVWLGSKYYVLKKAEKDIETMLLQHKGVHHYVQMMAHPELYALKSRKNIPEELYTPVLFSSSYMVRNMHDFYNEEREKAGLDKLYYKMAAENPRNPVNKASPFEKELIRMFNEKGSEPYFKEIQEIDGRKYLYVAIPFLRNNENCLKCHGRSEDAPEQLQALYPQKGGFNEKIGEIRAIESLRAPLTEAFALPYMALGSAAVVLAAIMSLLYFNRRLGIKVAERTNLIEKQADRLKESEERYREIVEETENLVTEVDSEGKFIFVNEAAKNIFELTPSECQGKPAFDFIHPDDREETQRHFQKWIEKRETNVTYENRQISQSGLVRNMLWSIKINYGDQGQVSTIRSIARDITERKKSEEACRRSEESLRGLFRALPLGVGTLKDRVVTSANDRMCEITGYPRDEIIGSGTRKFYADEAEFDRAGATIYGELSNAGRCFVEARWRRKDGRELNVLLGAAVAHEDPAQTDTVLSVMDMTEQHEKEALYRLLFEEAHDALFLMDGKRFVDCNVSALRTYGVEREQLIGASPLDFSPETQLDGQDSRQSGMQRITAALSDEPQVFEWRHLRGDGTPFDAEISLNSIPLGGKKYLLATSRDITERKQTLEALHASEESLSSIFRTVPTGIGVVSNRTLETVNDRFCEIFGYTREELVGDGARKLYVSEEEFRRCALEISEQLAQNEISSVEARMVRKDGSEIHVLINSSRPSTTTKGNVVISSILDITAQKRIEERLRASEERFKALHNASFGGITIHDKGKILDCNQGLSDITGYDLDELIGMDGLLLVAAEYRDKVMENIQAKYEEPYEAVGLRKNGERYPLRLAAKMIPYKDKTVRVVEFRDITEQKQAEEELRTHRDKLEDMVRERTEELTESNAELQRLIEASDDRSGQTAILNEMGELLQACETEAETYRVAVGVCAKLFPDDSGCLGILDESTWSIHVVGSWGKQHDCNSEFAHNDCWAIRRGKVHTVRNFETDPLCNHVRGKHGSGTLCVPMNAQGKVLGMAHMRFDSGMLEYKEQEQRRIVQEKRLLLSCLVERYAPSLVNLRLRESLREQSIRDRLTGLFNRRYMESALGRELARARRRGTPLTVIMIDVDHFKRFNDTYGHETGDEVLRVMGKYLNDSVRTEDVPCRYGGEELLLILPECNMKDGLTRAEGIRRGIEEDVMVVSNGARLQVTASLGIATFPLHGMEGEALLASADKALYIAKEGGRNKVVAHQADKKTPPAPGGYSSGKEE